MENGPPDRLTQLNGDRGRTWETRVGTIELRIPDTQSRPSALLLHKGSYVPESLEPQRVSEKALTAVVQEADIHGIWPLRRRLRVRPDRSTTWSAQWG
jgi:transposase-like protein